MDKTEIEINKTEIRMDKTEIEMDKTEIEVGYDSAFSYFRNFNATWNT